MNGKTAKKLRRLSKNLTIGKPEKETDKVYERLKATHNQNKKQK